MKPMEVWSVVQGLIPVPNPGERGYEVMTEVYVTVYAALKKMEEDEERKYSTRIDYESERRK